MLLRYQKFTAEPRIQVNYMALDEDGDEIEKIKYLTDQTLIDQAAALGEAIEAALGAMRAQSAASRVVPAPVAVPSAVAPAIADVMVASAVAPQMAAPSVAAAAAPAREPPSSPPPRAIAPVVKRYSLAQVVKDGPLTAPRWVHHLIKIATHTAVTALAHLLGIAWLPAALIGGPALFALIVVYERIRPSDPQPLTAWQHWADWLNDGALACVPVAVIVAPQHALVGSALGGVCFLLWLSCHSNARP